MKAPLNSIIKIYVYLPKAGFTKFFPIIVSDQIFGYNDKKSRIILNITSFS
jgi:hypothetical protein